MSTEVYSPTSSDSLSSSLYRDSTRSSSSRPSARSDAMDQSMCDDRDTTLSPDSRHHNDQMPRNKVKLPYEKGHVPKPGTEKITRSDYHEHPASVDDMPPNDWEDFRIIHEFRTVKPDAQPTLLAETLRSSMDTKKRNELDRSSTSHTSHTSQRTDSAPRSQSQSIHSTQSRSYKGVPSSPRSSTRRSGLYSNRVSLAEDMEAVLQKMEKTDPLIASSPYCISPRAPIKHQPPIETATTGGKQQINVVPKPLPFASVVVKPFVSTQKAAKGSGSGVVDETRRSRDQRRKGEGEQAEEAGGEAGENRDQPTTPRHQSRGRRTERRCGRRPMSVDTHKQRKWIYRESASASRTREGGGEDGGSESQAESEGGTTRRRKREAGDDWRMDIREQVWSAAFDRIRERIEEMSTLGATESRRKLYAKEQEEAWKSEVRQHIDKTMLQAEEKHEREKARQLSRHRELEREKEERYWRSEEQRERSWSSKHRTPERTTRQWRHFRGIGSKRQEGTGRKDESKAETGKEEAEERAQEKESLEQDPQHENASDDEPHEMHEDEPSDSGKEGQKEEEEEEEETKKIGALRRVVRSVDDKTSLGLEEKCDETLTKIEQREEEREKDRSKEEEKPVKEGDDSEHDRTGE